MLRIGITGGIGSGKSYISHLLSSVMNIPVYDCDREAKRLTADSPAIRQALQQVVGPDVYDEHGLVKQRLAAYLFASQEHAERINAIIHPAVRNDFRQWQQHQSSTVVAMESAILYESGFHTEVDCVLYVDAPAELRLQRAMARDNAKREQIEARMQMQQTANFRGQADAVILNDGVSDEELIEQLDTIITNEINNNKPSH